MQGKSIDDCTPEEWDAAAHANGWGVEIEFNEQISRPGGIIRIPKEKSDGSSANYYKLPDNANELQDLISAKNMNAQVGEIFRECYRYGQASHSDELRGIKKILFYANAELKRLEKYK